MHRKWRAKNFMVPLRILVDGQVGIMAWRGAMGFYAAFAHVRIAVVQHALPEVGESRVVPDLGAIVINVSQAKLVCRGKATRFDIAIGLHVEGFERLKAWRFNGVAFQRLQHGLGPLRRRGLDRDRLGILRYFVGQSFDFRDGGDFQAAQLFLGIVVASYGTRLGVAFDAGIRRVGASCKNLRGETHPQAFRYPFGFLDFCAFDFWPIGRAR